MRKSMRWGVVSIDARAYVFVSGSQSHTVSIRCVGSTTVWMVVGCILGYWVFVPTAFFSGLVAWPGSFNEYNIEGVCMFARHAHA